MKTKKEQLKLEPKKGVDAIRRLTSHLLYQMGGKEDRQV